METPASILIFPRPPGRFAALLLMLAVCCPAIFAEDFQDAELGISFTKPENWVIADREFLKQIPPVMSDEAISHARKKGIPADAAFVESAIITLVSKHPVDSPEDNPNLILAKEKAWAEGFENTGAGYLALMKDRIKVLGLPTAFSGTAQELKIGRTEFFYQDAVNTADPNTATKLRYICTSLDGYYIYFAFSYKDESDPDFIAMMQAVNSFKED